MPGSVVVIGGANLDIRAISAHGLVANTSNPGHVTIVPGGVARNIAENLARLGVRTSLISAIGTDAPGDQMLDQTAAAGVDVSGVLRVAGATGVYCAILNADGNLSVAVNAMSIVDRLTPDQIAFHHDKLGIADYIVADCNLPTETLRWLVDYAAENNKRLIIDPVSVPKCEKLLAALGAHGLFGVTPNRAQAEKLTSKPCGSPEAAELAVLALHDRGIGLVILHLDRDGVLVSELMRTGKPIMEHIPSDKTESALRDVTGGGDAAIAGFIFGLLNGLDSIAAARIGQIAAATVLSSPAGRLDSGKVLSAAGLRA